MSHTSADRDPFELLAEEFAARLRRGEHPSLTEYVERYPDHADDIRDLFPALALVEHFKPERQDVGLPLSAPSQASRGDDPAQLGDYRILRYLGEGGMGVVYEAVRESLRSHVALKVMHPQYRNRPNYLRRFHIEARSAARLHHTNIVSVFDFGEHEGICYYAMQFIAGQSMDKVLEDIRELRREQEGVPDGNTATLTVHAKTRGAHDDIAGEDDARCAMNSLRNTVTLGFLTGQFPSAGADVDPGEQATLPPSEEAVAPVVGEGDYGAATRRFLRELRQAEVMIRPPHGLPPRSQAAGDSERVRENGTTSSLTGKPDVRYYREVARLGAQVADALAYAHERGVLHRDIKPPNLILDPLGNIWVTDFGLAKFEEGDDLSKSQDLIGTLRYMAPERFRGISDRAGDIYALGATLYELLTFRPAFEGSDQLELIHRIGNDPPVPPRKLDHKIPRDLETIVLKALAKDPAHRFATALEMAAELRRFVENRPLRSRPISYPQQFRLWCKRNPKLAAANIAAAALTTILAIISTVYAITYRNQRNQIAIHFSDAREKLFDSLLSQAQAKRFSHRKGQRFESLDALADAAEIGRELKLEPERFELLRDAAIACMALPDLKATGRVIPLPEGAVLFTFDSAMTRYALRFLDGTILVRRVADDQQIAQFNARGDRDILTFSFSPDGRYLATTHAPDAGLTVWDVDRVEKSLDEKGPFLPSSSAKFSPDSLRIAACSADGALHVYDLATGHRLKRWPLPSPSDLAFRADGAQIALVCSENGKPACTVIDAESGRVVRSFPSLGDGKMDWSPDGTTLAITSHKRIDLMDLATGIRRTTLEIPTGGLKVSFHPHGTLLASVGNYGGLRLWDAILGRLALSVPSSSWAEFSRDGRIAVSSEGKLTTYQVNPAVEYRTLAHATSHEIYYAHASIRHDGRILAVGTEHGVVLWDLAHGTELGLLRIGLAFHSQFEESGDLLTSGVLGMWRWPLKVDTDRGVVKIGPPTRLPLPPSGAEIAVDQQSRVVAEANHTHAAILTPERKLKVEPLDDARAVAVSPDGQWLGTASHAAGGVQIWRISDASEVVKLPGVQNGGVRFSPDGQWILTTVAPCRLWAAGTWLEELQIGGHGLCFSRDGRLLAVQDDSKFIRIVETGTGRTVTRLESPDLCDAAYATFSPDGSRLVVTTADGPAVHVWDLRVIRSRLAGMGLDWVSPPYSADDAAGPSALPLPTLKVDHGPLRTVIEQLESHLQQQEVPAEDLVARYTDRLKAHPDDTDALHKRGHALRRLKHFDQALADFSAACALRPLEGDLRANQGMCLLDLKRYAPALDQLESAFQADPETVRTIYQLDTIMNNLSWILATGPKPQRDPALAARLAAFSVALVPGEHNSLNTLGIALCRAGKFAEAITSLEKSLKAGNGESAAFDLFFLAMAHHRLGHRAEAHGCFDRAVRWVGEQKSLSAQHAKELAEYRAEADAVLAGPSVPSDPLRILP